MSEPVFVDTGPWIALADPRDQWHRRAVHTLSQLRSGQHPLVTSNLVLIETYTGLVGRIQHRAIARFRATIIASAMVRVERVDELTEDLAWRLFMRYDDKAIGFVDCTSFAIMEQLGISSAFTFDRHFQQVGLRTLPTLA